MKYLISLFILISLFSCQKYSTENKTKEYLIKHQNVSEIELKNYNFMNNQLSDKEYIEKFIKLKEKQFKRYEEGDFLTDEGKYIDSLKRYKGNNLYTEVMYYRVLGKDTTALGYLYFDEKNNIVNLNLIR